MKDTVVFVYRLTSDEGLAPCVAGGFISLVCCKGGIRGLRHYIGTRFNSEYLNTDVWVMGICGKTMSVENKLVYLGKVQSVMTMQEYSKQYPERKDALYDDNGRIKGKEPCLHRYQSNHETDIKGKYALLFDKYKSWYFESYLPLWLERDSISNIRLHIRHIVCNESDTLYKLIESIGQEWFGKEIPEHPKNQSVCNKAHRKSVCRC